MPNPKAGFRPPLWLPVLLLLEPLLVEFLRL